MWPWQVVRTASCGTQLPNYLTQLPWYMNLTWRYAHIPEVNFLCQFRALQTDTQTDRQMQLNVLRCCIWGLVITECCLSCRSHSGSGQHEAHRVLHNRTRRATSLFRLCQLYARTVGYLGVWQRVLCLWLQGGHIFRYLILHCKVGESENFRVSRHFLGASIATVVMPASSFKKHHCFEQNLQVFWIALCLNSSMVLLFTFFYDGYIV